MYARFAAVLFLSFAVASALPSDLALLQAPSVTVPTALASPTSITTTTTVQTTNGTMNETCVFTFTPVGQQIQEIINCTTSIGAPVVAAAFVMPGTSIQVLPIGLGIYGGITIVAVFFVAFVTWERVQYRKAFRQQRMAENSTIAYGRVTKGNLTN